MTGLISTLGFDSSSVGSIFLFCAIFTFVVVTVLWVVGLFQGNHSMMDGWYGFAYAVPALLAYLIVGAQSVTAALLLFMVMLHGGRLGWYLAARWRRYVPKFGGDPRYLNFVAEMTPGYWWKSFFRVMEPQAVVIVLIGAPVVIGILQNREANGGIGVLGFAGLLVFMVGLYFETVADAQLQAFLAQEQRPRYLNTGVWKFSRHPNYFGTTTVWWGMWLVAMDGNTAAWWTVAGPVLNTIMLTSVLGSAFQDNYMGSRPEYQELMVRTRRFLPIPLSEAAIARNEARLAEQRAKAEAKAAV
jgi:steroid 5-alpha reductase family enzyme